MLISNAPPAAVVVDAAESVEATGATGAVAVAVADHPETVPMAPTTL